MIKFLKDGNHSHSRNVERRAAPGEERVLQVCVAFGRTLLGWSVCGLHTLNVKLGVGGLYMGRSRDKLGWGRRKI